MLYNAYLKHMYAYEAIVRIIIKLLLLLTHIDFDNHFVYLCAEWKKHFKGISIITSKTGVIQH
jgi:hypothetical protein